MPTLPLFFELGDYQFNSPGHHGTPQERLNAAQAYALGWQHVR